MKSDSRHPRELVVPARATTTHWEDIIRGDPWYQHELSRTTSSTSCIKRGPWYQHEPEITFVIITIIWIHIVPAGVSLIYGNMPSRGNSWYQHEPSWDDDNVV